MSEVRGEGNICVYNDVCLRYSVGEILAFTVICV